MTCVARTIRMEYEGRIYHLMNRGEESAETQTKRAERVIVEELKTRKWMEKELRKRPKDDGEKVAIARRLRAETVMTVSWISQRLHL